MGSNVLLIPHQETYLQSYRNFPEKRWHMLVTGFGGGKTRANTILCLQLISELQGKKDRAGDGARIIVAGYTLAHLEKTFMLYFRSYMNQSKTKWREDTKNHIAYCGTVTVIFLPMEQPDLLFGEDAVACFDKNTYVLTLRDDVICDVKIKDLKETDKVLTRKGWEKVNAVHNNGVRRCIQVNDIWVTPEHKWACGDDWICSNFINDRTKLVTVSKKEVKLWQEAKTVTERLKLILESWMEKGTTDTLMLNEAIRGITIGVRTIKLITSHYGKSTTERYLKGIVSTIETSIALIMNLAICSCSQLKNTIVFTLRNLNRTDFIRLTKDVKRAQNMLRKALKNRELIKCVQSAERYSRVYQCLFTALSDVSPLPRTEKVVKKELKEKLKLAVYGVAHTMIPSASLAGFVRSVAETLGNIQWGLPLLKGQKQECALSVEESLPQELQEKLQPAHRTVRMSKEQRLSEVYDITVDECHEYFVKGKNGYYCVHNCIQEESDELPESTLIEACKALSERTRQQIPGYRSPFLCIASTSQGQKGLYRLYNNFIKSGIGFVLVHGRTQDNFYLPRAQVIDLYKMYDETERKVFLDGEFLSVSKGRVFPGFDWARNYSDDDLDLHLPPNAKVFIGQDMNTGFSRASAWVSLRDKDGVYRMHCIGGSTLITTLRGNVPMRDVTTDDYVLTRKGYKKVLTKVAQGIKMVYDFGGLQCTLDHVAITPQGDIPVCRAKQFYYLKGQSTSDIAKARNGVARFQSWKKYVGSMLYGKDTLTQNDLSTEIISSTQRMVGRYSYTWRYITDLWVRYLMDGTSTIRKGSMITDLKALAVKVLDNTHYCTPHIRNVKCYQKRCGETGGTVSLTGQLLALFVAKILQLVPATKRLFGVKYVEKKGKKKDLERIIYYTVNALLTELVNGVEKSFKELLCSISAPTVDISESPVGRPIGMQQVYDIEVEGQHEFFAGGILVHNCCKRYDFADIADAPSTFRYDFPTQDIYWVPDVTIKDTYPHFARELRKFQIHIIHRSKNPIVEDSCFLVSKLCYLGLIIFHSMAKEAAEAVSVASRDKNNQIPKGKAPTDWQHDADSVRYATNYMALVLPEYRDIRQTLISHIASLRKEVEENGDEQPVRKLAAGYVQIEGDAYLNRT